MLSSERVQKIEAMSKEDMAGEVAMGNRSRYNEESRAYMQRRLAVMGVQEDQTTAVAKLDQTAEASVMGREANTISQEVYGATQRYPRWPAWKIAVGLLAAAAPVLLFVLYEYR